ncbi:MAG: hypoxanthine phosphoribosyltransferase [Syntrophobacterales bacterium]|nr:hypoxanthine phosphoribosyltransferase [Syntrophobacterales bacterium]
MLGARKAKVENEPWYRANTAKPCERWQGGAVVKESATEVLLPKEEIMGRVAELAAAITRDYQGKNLLVVGVLKGAFIFMADLLRMIQVPSAVDFVRIASYGRNQESSGRIVLGKDVETPVAGRDLLIVEDILDTGFTLSSLVDIMKQRQPASLKVCVLLDKPSRRRVPFTADYVGFSIPDEFVVGYGLDYDEKYRYFPEVRVLREN